MAFRVLHHDRCFDGACSAAVFTKLHREHLGGADGYEYIGLSHMPGGTFDEAVLQASGENAIVDFRYSTSPRMQWWFDHHGTTFRNEAEERDFEVRREGGKMFFDPAYTSCTGLIADVGRERFGLDTSGIGELLHWADIVDGAKYVSAQAAVEMDAPAMKLTLVIENAVSDTFVPRLIPLLTEMSLADVLAQPFVQEAVVPLWEKHLEGQQLIRQRAALRDGVIFYDLTDTAADGASKFIPYYYYPEAVYTIGLTRTQARLKISVGTNPWTDRPVETLVNLGEVCQRYGGGGHARVGAISYGADELVRGQAVASEIVACLRGEERQR